MDQESKSPETPLDDLHAQWAEERRRKQAKQDLVKAFNSVIELLFECSWRHNKESFLLSKEGEPYDDWINRFDMASVGREFVRRWPPLVASLRRNASIIGYDPEGIIAQPHCPPPERQRRCKYIARQFDRVFREHENEVLVESIAEEVAQVYAKEKRSLIGCYHELFEHMEPRLRNAYNDALRMIDAGLESAAGNTPIDYQDQAIREAIGRRLPPDLTNVAVGVYRGIKSYRGDDIPMKALKSLGIAPTTVERDRNHHCKVVIRSGHGKTYPKTYLLEYVVSRWRPRQRAR